MDSGPDVEKYHRVIGIDLGTTYSVVAAQNRFAETTDILEDKEGDNTSSTPSVVSARPRFDGKVLVGASAKRNLPYDPLNTIIEIKREMGQFFTKSTLKKYGAENEPFVALPDESEGPVTAGQLEAHPVQVQLFGRWFTPQEISALILMKMKTIA